MFGIPLDEITWKVVGAWTTKDTDLDYSVIVKHQPMTQMDSMLGSSLFPEGRPYRLNLMYFLKGTQLLIVALRCGAGQQELQSKNLIDLERCSLMTQPVVARKSRLLSPADRSFYGGEKFFFAPTQGDRDSLPCHPAFILRYSESAGCHEWESAQRFSAALKGRIHHSQLQRSELASPS